MKQAYNAYCFWLEEQKIQGQDISQFDDSHEMCFQAGYIAALAENSPEALERKKQIYEKIKIFFEKNKFSKLS